MDWHPSEDDLVLHVYRENAPQQRLEVDEHLAHCEVCRASWDETVALLRMADDEAGADPGPGFETRIWNRLVGEIQPQRQRWSIRSAVPFGALAAGIAGIAAAGYFSIQRVPVSSNPVAAVMEGPAPDVRAARERVLLSAVDAHLAQTEMLFVELLNSPEMPADASTLEFARHAAGDLVSDGRLYRATARDTGDTSVASVLDDLETVLVEVAHGGDGAGEQDFTALRARIEDDGLLFKVRAVTHEIRDRQSRMLSTGKGES